MIPDGLGSVRADNVRVLDVPCSSRKRSSSDGLPGPCQEVLWPARSQGRSLVTTLGGKIGIARLGNIMTTFPHIRESVGPTSKYASCGMVLFFGYLLLNVCKEVGTSHADHWAGYVAEWFATLLVTPFVLAGVVGGMHQRQQGQDCRGIGRFLSLAATHYLRVLAVFLLSWFLAIVIVLGLVRAGSALGWADSVGGKRLLCVFIPVSAVKLFWLAAVVVERGRVARGFLRALRMLASSPLALGVGLLWGAFTLADVMVPDVLAGQAPMPLAGARAAVLALAAMFAYPYAIAIYRNARVEVFGEPSEDVPVNVPDASASGGKLATAGFVFAFVSFLPPFNLAALCLGLMSLKRKKRFVTRAAVACCVGGFFIAVHLLVVAGLLLDRARPSTSPGYGFLAEVDSALAPEAALLKDGMFFEARTHLAAASTAEPETNWAILCASGIAKSQTGDLDEALADFGRASTLGPDRAEFFYYWAQALLDDGQIDRAGAQLELALGHEPPIADAERLLALTQNVYEPVNAVTLAWFVIILLLLFTFHEYAHAFAAWKLGDDTAKDQGRLTLSPFPHLDLFGSLLLPGFLLWRGSDIVFGWAKPVPVNPANFADPRRDHMLVSFAGPAMNLVIAMVCFLALGCLMLFVRVVWPEASALNVATPFGAVSVVGPPSTSWLVILIAFLRLLYYTSLILGCFNLIPIPPLDGSWILAGLLPEGARSVFDRVRPYSFLLVLALVATPALDVVLGIPVGVAWGLLGVCVEAMGFG